MGAFIMRLKVGTGGPPAGTYTATFAGVEQTTHEQWGPGLKWTFEIVAGPHRGTKAYRTTGLNATARNGCGVMLKAVTGRPLVLGEEHDCDQFLGEAYMIMVAETQSGSTRVETAIRQTALPSQLAAATAAVTNGAGAGGAATALEHARFN